MHLMVALMNVRSRLTGIATGDRTIVVERAAFVAVGGYPDQPLMGDIELSMRLKWFGPPAWLRERVVIFGRRFEETWVRRTILLMWRLRSDDWRCVPAQRRASRYRPPNGKQGLHE